MLRTLIAAQNRDPGFEPKGLVALELVLPSNRFSSNAAIEGFYDRLTDQIRGIPGVAAVGAVSCPPSTGDRGDWFYSVLDQAAPAPGQEPVSLFTTASPTYFETAGIAIREGRTFAPNDRTGAPLVAVVNETFARKWWPTGSAIGKRVKVGGPYREGATLEIVGVAGDVNQYGLDALPEPEIFTPFAQSPSQSMAVLIRASSDADALMPAIRRSVSAIDRSIPIQRLRRYEQVLGSTLDRRRFSTALLSLFALLAIALAGIGIFGLVSYWVRVRESEIAVRLALGAQRSAILRWAGAAVTRLVACGVVIGAAGAWVAAKWLNAMVFGISPRSPFTIALAAAAVALTACAAAAGPLWRAAHVDPVSKLSAN